MQFAAFAERAGAIEDEPADLVTRDLVADLLGESGDDLPIVARFVQGRVFPAWRSTTLDVGPSLCYAAIARAAGQNVTASDVEERLADRGEIGAVAASYDLGGQRGLASFGAGEDDLAVSEVAGSLRQLADAGGEGSEDRKVRLLFDLFNRCSPIEARYLARLVLGEMRIGVGEGTVRDAVAEAFEVPAGTVERALQVTNDYGEVARIAREEGPEKLEAVRLEVGRPVQSMLAQTGTVTDAIEEWIEVGVEIKYDGARVQAHYDGEDARLFSRNMEEVTDPLPEIVEFLEADLDTPAILDGEVVAVEDGEIQPFQEVLRRFRRKHDVERAREEVSLEAHVFDCLHAGGEDLLDRPLRERHDRLDDLLDAGVSRLWLESDAGTIEEREAEAIADGHEGIMLKNPESTYSPGRRGKNWLKRKPDVETLDLVVTGAEWGEGRRANLLGTFELSAWTDCGGFETIGNVATGITDEKLEDLTDLLEPHVRSESGTEVDIGPEVVFEVGYEEIQPSPTYSSGYALRFPRFLGVREDLTPDDVDTVERVERLAA
ncbi:MAG: ATP-dependent DNA ligase LigA [Halobacteriales archaeon]